ncbi:hypothetical protein NEDG_01664 [Nematocida displodere]|uniref:Uncharacterized protein n=1 Tax=Nematocida displodere TaxID=1805483 RepID=A0A177EIE5_9MICR|nr:hypothetical protein NEDG_01664 [Nematocida displodere]
MCHELRSPRTRRFSIIGSMKEFSSYMVDELFTAGQGCEKKVYDKLETGLMTGVDLKETDQPHMPEIEVVFLGMICILFTIFFKCTLFYSKPAFLDISLSDKWTNAVIVLTFIIVAKTGIVYCKKINV